MSDPLTETIIGAAIEVHRELGPGLLESAYEECLCVELLERGMKFRRQVPLPVSYKGTKIDCAYRLDLVVEEQVLLELKATDKVLPIHEARIITYMKLSGLETGLLMISTFDFSKTASNDSNFSSVISVVNKIA